MEGSTWPIVWLGSPHPFWLRFLIWQRGADCVNSEDTQESPPLSLILPGELPGAASLELPGQDPLWPPGPGPA